jgi:prepilin peptidase CpaA
VGEPSTVPFAVVMVAALFSAFTDLWKFKVYNLLTIPLLFSGFIYHGIVGGAPEFSISLMGALFGFASLIVLYVMGGTGAGDVKLMSAVGAWLGLPMIYHVFIASAIAQGLYAVVLIVMSSKPKDAWINLQILWHRMTIFGRYLGADDRVEAHVVRDDRRKRCIPFAAMLAIGIIATLVWLRESQSP